MTAITLSVELNALTECPCYESHKRGKNWAATIRLDPASPGGLSRDFWPRAHGEYYYLLPKSLRVGDAVEFGADYYSSGGRKNANRWYGVVRAISDAEITLEKHGTGKDACKAKPAPVDEPVAA